MFGTAIANVLAENGHQVELWTRDSAQAEVMNRTRENTRSLPGYQLHEGVFVTSELRSSVQSAEIVFVAVPSGAFRGVIQKIKGFLLDGVMLVSTTKGIESDGFRLMSHVLAEEVPEASIGVLSGPNLAEEIAQKQLTATVIASRDARLTTDIQEVLHTQYFRVYASDDVFGVELAGALKNIYAIAAGFAAALGVGQNTQGLLLTRSLAEMSRFASVMGANPLTFLGLAGVGDLMVTCSSSLSRNYQTGMLLGKGHNLEQAVEKLGRLAEGVNTVKLVKEKAEELDIYMPLATGLYEILYHEEPVDKVVNALMMADQATDVEFFLGGVPGKD